MPFDYFNTGYLAFGSKLTRAFRQLEKMFNDAEDNIGVTLKNLEILGDYVNRNYRAPFPTSEDMAVRCSELFDVINDSYYFKELEYKDGTLRISINLFDRQTNRMTILSGSTSIKEGYAYFKKSVSNISPASTITFSEKQDDGLGVVLFKYRIDYNNFINIEDGTSDVISFGVGNMDKINDISFGDSLTLPYEATDYCCVAVFGKWNNNQGTSLSVQLNSKDIFTSRGSGHKNTCFVYLKPKDVLKASVYDSAKFVKYRKV